MKKTMTIFFSIILLSVIGLIFLSNDGWNLKKNSKKNIVVIVSDSLRYDVLGINGGEAKTPNIDWLARNGCNFKRAYSSSPRTLPSSVGMFTGNTPGVYPYIPKTKDTSARYVVPEKDYLFAEALKDAGYHVKAYVTNPNSYLSKNLQGFITETSREYVTVQQEENIKEITGQIKSYKSYHQVYSFIDTILKLSPAMNFFHLVWIADPHLPFAPPSEYMGKKIVDQDKLTKPIKSYAMLSQAEYLKLNDYEKKYVKDLYVKEVESMDERIGLIIKTLKHENILDETIVVFTADHGEHFNEHNVFSHGGTYYEELQHIPLIISGPGVPKNKEIHEVVSLLDLTATLNELLHFNYKSDSAAKSFSSLLNGGSIENTPHYFIGTRFAYQKFVDALLWDNFKFISLADGSFELFDVVIDPKEKINLVGSHPDVVKRLQEKLFEFRGINKEKQQLKQGLVDNETSHLKKDNKDTLERLKSLGYMK